VPGFGFILLGARQAGTRRPGITVESAVFWLGSGVGKKSSSNARQRSLPAGPVLLLTGEMPF